MRRRAELLIDSKLEESFVFLAPVSQMIRTNEIGTFTDEDIGGLIQVYKDNGWVFKPIKLNFDFTIHDGNHRHYIAQTILQVDTIPAKFV